MRLSLAELEQNQQFIDRHIGPDAEQTASMLNTIGVDSMAQLIEQTIPPTIMNAKPLGVGAPMSEANALSRLRKIASQNELRKNYIGLGYYDTLLPGVIQRNVLENPGWYTAYTPYQPEIAQGRLEALLNFQQMCSDLSGMELANASMLDEATAAAEAMAMAKRVSKNRKANTFFVAEDVHPQTIDVVRERASYFGFELVVAPAAEVVNHTLFGALFQYPSTTGELLDLRPWTESLHQQKAISCVATDLLSLTLLTPPGEMGADIVVGSSQRFGVPMGYGGPHAAFFATRESFKRALPGRVIGVSQDRHGNKALRMALQTREQHIRREKANSNICTAQVLLANMAAFYAVYHGPQGLKTIAQRVHRLTDILAKGLMDRGYRLSHDSWFDTITLETSERGAILKRAEMHKVNLRMDRPGEIGISLDETTSVADVAELFDVLLGKEHGLDVRALDRELIQHPYHSIKPALQRSSDYLTHEVFNRYHSETEMLRYLHRLERKDLTLNYGMIPLGSCTMKLNATSEMLPVSWPEFSRMHPFAPLEQAKGYLQLIDELRDALAKVTGYDSVCMQPNSGASGEYAGLLAIQKYHASRGEGERNVCLIPSSAHGTNPASAQMAGLKVVVVACDKEGNISLDDLTAKAEQHQEELSCVMVTYPSTHGVYEETIQAVCEIVHRCGGQVYLDGANMNAQVGLTNPGYIGADVSHLNLHKTFAIPHGGGGPGMGPIGIKSHLAPFVAGHSLVKEGLASDDNGAVSAAPFGSASILPISWMYLVMLGDEGLKRSTEVAILNANYVAHRLKDAYPVLYTGRHHRVAHECIIDLRPLKEQTGITELDIAKRLMDYGFHAPTMSFPVAGTLMIEPTESESKYELDRFIEAMLSIRAEIDKVGCGEWPAEDNPLVNAPHTELDLMQPEWGHPYSREEAAYPAACERGNKFWPTVARVDDVYGDRHLFCSCVPVEEYA
ncbi:aminomethyl-transferring glycine dehydrogenase [Dongshaea marina]|uniref:aminomethyl-transferring glycine dehydrogenase n=1 Tax=Dongshaea marina TaxID=2047966 RepID=UPI000D3EA72F|nr:aminomethyl-transferring glycine dehydrogenase [Dongshaea marina]